MTPEVHYHVCTAHDEYLSEALRELERRVRRRFYVSQAITRGLPK